MTTNAVKLAKAAADTSVITATATQTLSNKTLAGQLIVTSNTLVANLNSDMLDGKHVGTTGSAIPALDGNNIWVGEQRFQSTATYMGDPSSNTYIEFSRATNYPFIDFHSNTNVDFSGRIACSGTTAGTGGGTLDYVAAVHNFASGDFIASWNYGTINLGGSSRSQQINIGTGSTGSGNTKSIGFGTGGIAGSTTNINIGSWVQGALGKTIANQGMQLGSNGTPIYQTKLDFGGDTAGTWRKLFTVSLGTGQFQTAAYKIDIVDPNANHAVIGSVNPDKYTYYVACIRTESTVQDYPDACYISGPASHIRAVRLSTGNYEIQVANEILYQEYLISVQLYAENGGQTAATYYDGSALASVGANTYTAAVGTATDWFQRVRVLGNGNDDALRITQIGAGNALVVEDSANPDADPFVIKADGNIITGFTNQVAGAQYNPRLEIVGNDPSGSGLGQFHYSNDTLASRHQFNKTRATAPAGHVIVASNDELGTLTFAGSDGTGYIRGAQISAYVDGTPGTNDMPGRLVFSTTADGASTPTARMLVNSAGNVGIGTTSPTAKLDVVGTANVSAIITPSITAPSANLTLSAVGANSIIFSTGGGTQFEIDNTPSSTNYAAITGAMTGLDPTISAQGSDYNIGLNYKTKGVGSHNFIGGGYGTEFMVYSYGGITDNYWSVVGAGTSSGSVPYLVAQGSDTNVTGVIAAKGTGSLRFLTGWKDQFRISHTASAVNYLQVTGNSTANAPEISAQGSDTNISIALTPKGSGNVSIAGTLMISSNTLVANLNSDLLDGQSGSYYLNAGNLTGTINTSVLVAGTPSQNELLTYNETANSWANTLPQDNNNLIAMSMIF